MLLPARKDSSDVPFRRSGPARSAPWRPVALAIIALGFFFSQMPCAEAQYRNQQFGFELGYHFLESKLGVEEHGGIGGLRAGFKATDHWWFTARAMLSFRGDQVPDENTVILFQLTPVDVRYYFETDNFRPYLGGGTTFQFLFNTSVRSTIQWGVGPVAGLEFKLKRDLFLAFQVEGTYFVAFDDQNVFSLTATTQLLFFL